MTTFYTGDDSMEIPTISLCSNKPNPFSQLVSSLAEFNAVARRIDKIGIHFEDPNELMVEVLVSGLGKEDWSIENGGAPEEASGFSVDRFPDYIPLEFFNGKKEGDLVILGNQPFRLQNAGSRYASHGMIEEVFKKLYQ